MMNFAKRFDKNLVKPILYKCVSKFFIGLTLILLWNRFINTNHYYSVVEFAFFILGMFFVVFAWISYLKMDGIKIHGLEIFKENKTKSEKAMWRMHDMVDFVEEPAVSFDHLSDEEQKKAAFFSNCITALLFLVPSFWAMMW